MGQCCSTTKTNPQGPWPKKPNKHKSILGGTGRVAVEVPPTAAEQPFDEPGADASDDDAAQALISHSVEQRVELCMERTNAPAFQLENVLAKRSKQHKQQSRSTAASSKEVDMTMTDYPDFVGLPNRSCDCFWNATLQCLRHTPKLQRIILESSQPRPGVLPGKNLLHAFANLLLCMDKYAGMGRVVPRNAPQRAHFVEQATEEVRSFAPPLPIADHRRLSNAKSHSKCIKAYPWTLLLLRSRRL
eukprot:SAG11_NODE_6355_length_1329_cov_1.760163_1_plen_245_part_00